MVEFPLAAVKLRVGHPRMVIGLSPGDGHIKGIHRLDRLPVRECVIA